MFNIAYNIKKCCYQLYVLPINESIYSFSRKILFVMDIFCERNRSSHLRCSMKKLFLKFCNIYRKTPVLESLFDEVAGLKTCNFIKKRLQHRCFSVNILKFLRTPILKNICQRLRSNKTIFCSLFKQRCSENIYLFKAKNRNTRKSCKICSK